MERLTASSPGRSPTWKWWFCGLLLLASAINYMDRQALANAAVRISGQFHLSQEQYGNLELGFGWAFAGGSLFFGWLVDRSQVRRIYPAVLFLWSAVGFATGFVESYSGLLFCRTLLGWFEAGHWPCAIKATQRLLEPKDRSMGNSLLQSGTSVGAIFTPLLMRALMTQDPGSWRGAFMVIGAIGLLWILLWFATVRPSDLAAAEVADGAAPRSNGSMDAGPWKVLLSRRMVVVLVVIAMINTSWQIIRAWLPKFLQEGRGYTEGEALYFNALFFVATDIGCIGAGALTLWWHGRGWSVHRARLVTFLVCSILSAMTLAAVMFPRGWLLLGALLVVGAGMLGLFPVYHAISQDVSAHHQGKVTGLASMAAWAFSPAQKYFGRLVDQTGSFDAGFAAAGCLPLIACLVLWLGWKTEPAGGRGIPAALSSSA